MKWFPVIVLFACCAAQELHILNTLETVKLPIPVAADNEVNNTRIIGGTNTNISRYPYTVQVLYLRQLACGGSLVTRRHVLTAAHCFFDEHGNVVSHTHYLVRAGSTTLNTGGSTRAVSRVVTHERFNSPIIRDNDVAIMVLASTFSLGSNIAVARIPAQGEKVPDNSTVWHVGWGRTNVNSAAPSQILQEVQVRTIPLEICREQYRMLETLTSEPYPVTLNMICSGLLGVGGKDACQGDSGGPLVYYDIVVGVTSWGYGCAEPLFPGINANTSAFTNWINSTVTRYNASPAMGNSWILLVASLLFSLIFCSNL